MTFSKFNVLLSTGGECSISSISWCKFENTTVMIHREKGKDVNEMLGRNLGIYLVRPMWFIIVSSVGSC